MINKKNKSIIFVTISLLCIILSIVIYILEKSGGSFSSLATVFKRWHLKETVDIVAILSGISGILVGIASIRISNLGAVKEYFQQGDAKEYAEARKNLYQKFDAGIKINKDDRDASNVISFFHFWGMMVEKKYLPIWAFESASGQAVIRLYEGLQDMIKERRRDNPNYGEYFEWLYRKCKSKKRKPFKKDIAIEHVQVRNYTSFLSQKELEEIGFCSYGTNVKISRYARIYSPEKIKIGDNVRIDDFCILSGKISMGSYIHISPYTCLIAGDYGITLKDFTTVSSRCAIYAVSDDYSGHSLTNPMISSPYRCPYGGEVILKKYSIIGSGSVVLPNVTIGKGSAVGAMSLVKTSVPKWIICAGVPCKKVKKRSKDLKKLENKMITEQKAGVNT